MDIAGWQNIPGRNLFMPVKETTHHPYTACFLPINLSLRSNIDGVVSYYKPV
jgi:hypothetical protein